MKSQRDKFSVGIDAMAFYVPPIYLDLQTLAPARNLDVEKLSKGLGVLKMALPDCCEDAASMAANAVWKLLKDYQINPKNIGRLYVGTESGLDGAKPIATYILGMINEKWQAEQQSKEEFFGNCDVIDMTFACIGGVDALQNTLDWAVGDENRMGIVVATDYAKYEKFSGGEYTQGAGAVAMLIKANPKLLVINDVWGVSVKSEHDFFKPQFSETPTFDGHFSNSCYQNRLRDAFFGFRQAAIEAQLYDKNVVLSDEWDNLVFHLPYAFHGKRIFSEIFTEERKSLQHLPNFSAALQLSAQDFDNLTTEEQNKMVAKSSLYNNFVKQKIASGQLASSQIGNMYTASIFMALMSCLETQYNDNQAISNQKIGFCAYGSGSKAKVFQGIVQPTYKEIVAKFNLFATLNQRKAIDMESYEKLHDKQQITPLTTAKQRFVLAKIATEPITLKGARFYEWEN
jgi:hydroxymethylglutaryl-CoA synthase